MGAIGGILVIGLVLLIVIVLVYRTPPGRTLGPATPTPAHTVVPSPH